MAKYRAYVDAIQWIGTNATDVRAFLKMTQNLLNLFGTPTVNAGVITIPLLFAFAPNNPIVVNMNDWIVRNGNMIEVWNQADFDLRYLAEP